MKPKRRNNHKRLLPQISNNINYEKLRGGIYYRIEVS